MRKLPLLLALSGTGACSTAPSAPPPHGITPGRACVAAGESQFVGQPANQATGAAIMRATNAANLRWVRPGMMLTMEYRADRVTVRIGPDGRIAAVNCG